MSTQNEKWLIWKPLDKTENSFEIDSILLSENKLKLILENIVNKNEKLEFDFETHALVCQFIEEGFRLKTLEYLYNESKKNQDDNLLKSNFYRVVNSKLIEKTSKNYQENIYHFVFFDSNLSFEVLATIYPRINYTKT